MRISSTVMMMNNYCYANLLLRTFASISLCREKEVFMHIEHCFTRSSSKQTNETKSPKNWVNEKIQHSNNNWEKAWEWIKSIELWISITIFKAISFTQKHRNIQKKKTAATRQTIKLLTVNLSVCTFYWWYLKFCVRFFFFWFFLGDRKQK